MIKWIVILLVVSFIAGALGFRAVSGGAYKIAMILIALLVGFLAVILLLFAWAGGGIV